MFYKYQSNSLLNLATLFSTEVKSDPQNPLQPVWVIVQNNEIREWLSLHYASEKGISANFRFILPSEFLWMLYRIKKPEIPQQLPGDLNAMHWTLFRIFSEKPELLDHIPSFVNNAREPKRLFQFCGQLADVFDLYQVYRPEMLNRWLNSSLSTQSPDEKWQAVIWGELNRYWSSTFSSKEFPSRSQAFHDLLTWIDNDRELAEQIPDSVYVFGLSQSSKPFLEIVTSLSRIMDVHYFERFTPVNKDNPISELLQKWSRSEHKQSNLLNSLLQKKNVTQQEKYISTDDENTFSHISLHSCHNKRRETEVLKDEILRFLDDNPNKGPDDVLVLVPDAEGYAQTLKTVFEHAEGEPILPVSRLFSNNLDSVTHTTILILDLLTSDFKSTDVVQLLSLTPVKEKFDFSDADLDLIEEWIHRNKMLFGIGETHDTSYSWQKGLSQLMAGFAMEPDFPETFEEIIPDKGISTTDQIELIAKLSDFVYSFKLFSDQKEEPKSADEWLGLTEKIIDTFNGETEILTVQKIRVYKTIERIREQVSFSKYEEKLSYDLIKPWLTELLFSASSGSGRFGQGIMVSTYVPYRSVPFDFIAVLGMNEGIFPRQVIRPSFDLINQFPEPGDRIFKEDDTYLFAETIQAAQQHLHLSYEGKEQRTDTEKLPSILIQQLKDILEEELTVREHSLHPFNAVNFKGESRSYSAKNAALGTMIQNPSNQNENFLNDDFSQGFESGNQIQIADFIRFFIHPCKHFLTDELALSSYNDIIELSDREAFTLGGLEKYELDRFLFQSMIHGHSKEDVFNYSKAAQLIPEGLAGEKSFEKRQILVNELYQQIEKHTTVDSQSLEIEAESGEYKLSGIVQDVFGDNLISVGIGSLKAKNLAEHWIKHLLLLKSGADCKQSIFITKEKKYGKEYIQTLTIDSEKIKTLPIKDYVNWYLQSDHIPGKLNFFPESSFAYAESFLKDQNHEKALKKALGEWEPSAFKFGAESEDYYNHLVWRGRHPFEDSSFTENALNFWKPYFQAEPEARK